MVKYQQYPGIAGIQWSPSIDNSGFRDHGRKILQCSIWATKLQYWRTAVDEPHDSSPHTVVKWGHTEGIEREKTSSQKFTVIALDFWRNKLLLVFQIWGQNTIGGQFLEYCHLIWNCPWFLKRFLIFQIWGYYLQKVNAKCLQISDEKSFAPLLNNFLILILKNQKLFVKETKLFFSSEIWGYCIYFLQVIIRIWGHLNSAGIACKI